MSQKMSAPQSDEELYQLSKEELVKIIQALRAELERLKEIVNKDSKSSSKPPSQDIIKKSEKKKSEQQTSDDGEKRKPGGQPEHQGKTRKGFERVDRISSLNPEKCPHCGGIHFQQQAAKIEKLQTCRSQKRSVIDFLASAIKAHTRNQIIFPSLIPCSAT